MPPLRKIAPGETLRSLPANTWNSLVDGEQRDRTKDVSEGPAPVFGGGVLPVRVNVRNKSLADRNHRFPILRVTDTIPIPADLDDDEGIALQGVLLDAEGATEDTLANFVVVQGPIEKDAMGVAVIVGMTWAVVDIQETSDDWAQAQSSEYEELISHARFGARIVWKPPGETGPQLCIIDLGRKKEQTMLLYAITTTIAAATWNDGTAKLTPTFEPQPRISEHGDNDGTYTFEDGSNEDEIGNPFGTAITVTSGKFKVAEVIDGLIVSVDCTEFDLPAP